MGKEESVRLGAFLRTRREKMQLSQEQIAQKIHLRRFVIDAIENEAWDRLPPPVFVRGFVRSYARTLELDEKKALELYRLTAPPEKDTLKTMALLRPTHRGRTLIILGALVIVLCVFYFWHLKSSTGDREHPVAAERAAPLQRAEGVPPIGPEPLEADAPAAEKPMAPEKRVQEETRPDMEGTGTAEEVAASEERVQEEEPPAPAPVPPVEAPSPWLVLKGEVKETTWVSIRVDGGEPREFMFQPGEKPQWKAREGFEIIIGNAAGLDLDLDGKTLDNLGRPGQVVRLRLP